MSSLPELPFCVHCRYNQPKEVAIGMVESWMPPDMEDEWLEWYSLTPLQRWQQSQALWWDYIRMGGSLDPQPDTQSPFFDPAAPGSGAPDGRTGLRVLRRSGV